MRHEEAIRQFVEYLEGNLRGRQLRDFEEHVRGCKRCQKELQALRKLDARLRREVPSYWEGLAPGLGSSVELEKKKE